MTEERVDTHQTGDAVEPGQKRCDDPLGRRGPFSSRI
jgi:hypothetical protein